MEAERGGHGIGAAVGREHDIVVGVGQRVPDGGGFGVQAEVAVAGVGGVERRVPVAQVHELDEQVAVFADGSRDLHGQRFGDAFGQRADDVAGAEVGDVFGAVRIHDGDGVPGGAGGGAGEIVGGERPDEQAGAGGERGALVRDRDARGIARLPAAVVEVVGVEVRGAFPDLVDPDGGCEIAGVDRLRVAIDPVRFAGESGAFVPGEERLAGAVEGGDVRGLGQGGVGVRAIGIGGEQNGAGVGGQRQARRGDGREGTAVAAAGVDGAAAARRRAPPGSAEIRDGHGRVGRVHHHDAVGIIAPEDAPVRVPERADAGREGAGGAAEIELVFGVVFQRDGVAGEKVEIGGGAFDEQIAGRGEHPFAGAAGRGIRLADDDLVAAGQIQRAVYLEFPVGGIEVAVRTPEGEALDHAAVAEAVVHGEPRRDQRAEIREEDEAVGAGEGVARGGAELLEAGHPGGEAAVDVVEPRVGGRALAEAVGVGREAVGEDAVVLGRADAGEDVADPIGGETGDGRPVRVADVHDVPVPLVLVHALAVRGRQEPVGLRVHEGPIGGPRVADDERGGAGADAELVMEAQEIGVVGAERLDFRLEHFLGAGEMRGGEPALRGVEVAGQLVGEGHDALARVGPGPGGESRNGQGHESRRPHGQAETRRSRTHGRRGHGSSISRFDGSGNGNETLFRSPRADRAPAGFRFP